MKFVSSVAPSETPGRAQLFEIDACSLLENFQRESLPQLHPGRTEQSAD